MGRRKQSLQNTAVALVSQLLVVLVGLFFPRAIILNYGSRANGLIGSLQQLMQYALLMEAGLAGAATYALYAPLARRDDRLINKILSCVKKAYEKTGWTFSALVILLAAVYPRLIADTGYSESSVSALLVLMAVNGATQLFFSGKYRVLLNASQNSRYASLLNALTTCLFSGIIIGLAYAGVSLVTAVFWGCSAYLLRTAAFSLVSRRLFPALDLRGRETGICLENQREVFLQQVLSLLVMNSGTLLLSFSKTDMAEISVFTIYNMVLTAVLMITGAVHTGVSAAFGDLISRKDREKLQNAYRAYEKLYLIFWTVLFTCTSVLYQPFLALYTGKFTDGNYIRPGLCLLFSIYGALWSVRTQQSVLVVAAGKFREIQKQSILEAVLTILLSGAGLWLWGLEGLMLGRCLAAAYRMVDFVGFSHRHVLELPGWFSLKGILASAGAVVILNLLGRYLLQWFSVDTYLRWGCFACLLGVTAGCTGAAVSRMVYRERKGGGCR